MQWLGEFYQRSQRWLALAAFKHADEIPLEASLEAKLLLRQSSLLAQVAQDTSERDREVQKLLQLWLEKLSRLTIILSANHSVNFWLTGRFHVTATASTTGVAMDTYRNELRGLPLCRSYVCVFFDEYTLRACGQADVRSEQLRWAAGVLPDGSAQFLGCWYRSDLMVTAWRSIADDLHSRGVERLRFILGAQIKAAMAAHYRDAVVLPTSGETVDQTAMDSVLPGHRRYLEIAHEVASQLKRRFSRAAARQGSFADPGAAAALLRRTAERYIAANWPDPVRTWRAPRLVGCSGLTARS